MAVLEEEVVRLEEQVVHCRQGLYQQAVHISSSKRDMENSADLYDPYRIKDYKHKQSKISIQSDGNSIISASINPPPLPGNS